MNIQRTLRAQISLFRSLRQHYVNTYQLRNASDIPASKKLMQFFDDEKNWGQIEVKSGRSWKLEELRIKSNADLHKLWYILLKEKNMLLTMEEESKEQVKLFPSPERIDKVEDSMENLETVIRERNRAYFELETGESGEIPVEEVTGPFGLPIQHKYEEYAIPKEQNKEWIEAHTYDNENEDVKKFVRRYTEQQKKIQRRERVRNFNHVCGLLKRFPEMDLEAVKEQYPDVDIKKALNSNRSRGHFVPK